MPAAERGTPGRRSAFAGVIALAWMALGAAADPAPNPKPTVAHAASKTAAASTASRPALAHPAAKMAAAGPVSKTTAASALPKPTAAGPVSKTTALKPAAAGPASKTGGASPSPKPAVASVARAPAGPAVKAAAPVAKTVLAGAEPAAVAAALSGPVAHVWSGASCSRLAYVQTVKVNKTDLRYDLRVSLPDGSRAVTVWWSMEPLMTPAWSPDGLFLTYTAFFRGRTAIVEQRLATRSRRTLSIREGLNSAPAYSPDGRSLAYTLSNGSAVNIFVEDLRTYKIRRLTDGRFVDTEPAWSPDGHSIAFTSDRAHGTHIYVVPAEGGKAVMVSPHGETAVHPVFTPDGHSVVYSSLHARAYRICRLDLKSHQVRYQTSGRSDQNPAVSPDGKFIVWVGGTMTQRTLHGMQVDRPEHVLWSGPSSVQEVAWSPCVFGH